MSYGLWENSIVSPTLFERTSVLSTACALKIGYGRNILVPPTKTRWNLEEEIMLNKHFLKWLFKTSPFQTTVITVGIAVILAAILFQIVTKLIGY